jgi:T5SS/PEP-CTERM-associated repeat protein
MTVIGRLGTGNLSISNAGTMSTQVFGNTGGGQQGTVGASLGSVPYTLTLNQTPDAGGNGTATITGIGSRWSILGSLQLGGFDLGVSSGGPLSTGGDLEGDNTQYGSQAGRGTLYVNDGGLVSVQNAIGAQTGQGQNTPLVMAIGRFGIVQMNGGTVQIGAAEAGQQNAATPDSVQIINDGLITGTGRINTGVFRNRYLGNVRVDPGQSLVIDSSSEFSTAAGQQSFEPLSNYGTIQVLGNSQMQAQLEFVRSPVESETNNSVRPFVNLPLPSTPPVVLPAFGGGLISAQYATMRFGSGLQNQSLVAFTAGTNYVTGRVVNLALDTLDSDDGDAGDSTEMLVSGAATTAVFQDDLAFGSGAHLNLVDGGKVVVLNQHSFTLSGDLSMTLSYTHPSLITVSGDVGIGQGTTDLTLNLAADALHSLHHGDAFQLISFGGDIGNVDPTNPLNPIPDLAGLPVFSDIDVSPNIFALYGLVTQIQFSNEGVYAVFLDPTQVGPPGGGGAIAPDFNGDGVVDLADFAIWQSHVGINSGASVLDGDADGDGDVDGADFLFWQRNVGKPMPWTGSGSGSGSELASVPEPTGLIMLACCGSLALAFSNRRSKR